MRPLKGTLQSVQSPECVAVSPVVLGRSHGVGCSFNGQEIRAVQAVKVCGPDRAVISYFLLLIFYTVASFIAGRKLYGPLHCVWHSERRAFFKLEKRFL